MYFVQMMKILNEKRGFPALCGLLAHDLLPMSSLSGVCLLQCLCVSHCFTLSLFLQFLKIHKVPKPTDTGLVISPKSPKIVSVCLSVFFLTRPLPQSCCKAAAHTQGFMLGFELCHCACAASIPTGWTIYQVANSLSRIKFSGSNCCDSLHLSWVIKAGSDEQRWWDCGEIANVQKEARNWTISPMTLVIDHIRWGF